MCCMVHFASYPLPMAPFSPLLSWRKTILQAQGNRKRNSVGSTLKMFGFWNVQKVFDVLVVPKFVWEDALSSDSWISCEFAGIQVKLCWKERLRVAPVFPPRETSLPGDAHCYTLAHYTSLLLRKKNPEKPWQPWLRHAPKHRSHPGWKCTTSPWKGLWSWFSRFGKKMEDFSDGFGLPASKWSLPVSYRFAKSDRTHQCLAAIDEATSLFLSSAPLSPERTSTTMCEDCWDIIFFKSFSSSKSTECMYPILFAAMSPTWNPTEQKLGLLAKKMLLFNPWPSPMFAFDVLVLKHNDTHTHTRTYKQANLARLTCFFNMASGRKSCVFQNFFHTSTWNVVNNKVFHGQYPLIRPRKHNNSSDVWGDIFKNWSRPGNYNNTLFLELVNCKSLPVSSMGRPPGKTCIFSSKGFRPSCGHGHVIARFSHGFGTLIVRQVQNSCLSSDVWGEFLQRNVDLRNQVACHLSGAPRITWRSPCLEHFCSTQLNHKQSSIENTRWMFGTFPPVFKWNFQGEVQRHTNKDIQLSRPGKTHMFFFNKASGWNSCPFRWNEEDTAGTQNCSVLLGDTFTLEVISDILWRPAEWKSSLKQLRFTTKQA